MLKAIGFFVLGGLVVAALLSHARVDSPEATGEQSRAIALRPENLDWLRPSELLSDYHYNEVSADARYKGRRIGVTGTINSINKDFMDRPYLVLAGGDNMFMTVHAAFSDDHLSELMNLSPSETVHVSCRVKGMVIGSVMLDRCQFVAEAPSQKPETKVAYASEAAPSSESADLASQPTQELPRLPAASGSEVEVTTAAAVGSSQTSEPANTQSVANGAQQ